MTERIINCIKEADFILLGVGEELDSIRKINSESEYQQIKVETKGKWVLPFVRKLMLDQDESEKETYRGLLKILEGKNYFIVSTCQDGKIEKAGFRGDRVVAPCGGYEKLQCREACTNVLYDVSKELLDQIKNYMNGVCAEKELNEPLCPACGKPLAFNNVEADHYVEEGYRDQWMLYKKWLQGTVNRKICILELGVGMKYPTVIRWPFEKVAFFNQKADYFRIHSKLYQIPKELGERGKGICQSPEKFLKELSNSF